MTRLLMQPCSLEHRHCDGGPHLGVVRADRQEPRPVAEAVWIASTQARNSARVHSKR
ncbi:MAG: hypothetical protein U0841_04475 [Chloroflexia bacterium]